MRQLPLWQLETRAPWLQPINRSIHVDAHAPPPTTNPPPTMAASPDAVLHLAALHTLAQTGFASTSRAASVTLSGVLSRYLQLVATSCTERAALAGRSKVAAIDVVNALEDLGVGGITELQEWTADLDKEISFTGGKMDELAGGLRGLTIIQLTARLPPRWIEHFNRH